MIMLSAPLSCGHLATDDCNCADTKSAFVDHVAEALAGNQGRWREVLTSYGVELPPHKKNGPCPVCSGGDPKSDRFIFDDKNGRGTWHCRRCDVSAGGGLLLLSRYLGLSVVETAKKLNSGTVYAKESGSRLAAASQAAEREAELAAQEAEKKARWIMQNSSKGQHSYLTDRGLPVAVDIYRQMIAVPVYKNKRLINVQLIAADRKKTFLKGGRVAGGYHLIRGGESIAICEGYATAITVQMITGCATFCAFSAGNLFDIAQKIRIAFPDRRITIFADRDQDCERLGNGGAGVHYATIAAQAVGARICTPTKVGDWDDIRQEIGAENCRAQMLKQIKTA